MVELREPLEELIHSPRQFTADSAFPRANEIRLYGVTTPGFRYDMRGQLRLEVGQMSGLPVAAAEPIIGHNVFTDEIRAHYHNLNSLGLTEDDLVANALVLGPEPE